MKKILITGGAGFVGSSVALFLKRKYPDYEITCLDNLKRRGSELNLPRLRAGGVQFIHGDIRNREDIVDLPDHFTTIIEASAEPSVLAGLAGGPEYLINTNLSGTIHCLYLAARTKADFIFLSTSRIYPVAAIENIAFEEEPTRFAIAANQSMQGVSKEGISEDFTLEGFRSLYGATKLSSEYLIREFAHFYQLRTVVNRCGVIAGPWQMGKIDQGVAVLWMARHFWKRPLQYIGYGGSGKQVRDMLHVDDLSELLDYEIHHMDVVKGCTFNAGGGLTGSASLRELTAICERISGNRISIEGVDKNREADIRIYITDNRVIQKTTGWMPRHGVEKIMRDIHSWLAANEKSLEPILNK